MQKSKNYFSFFLLIIFSIVLIGCSAGTVEEGEVKETKYEEPKKLNLNFMGISDARAVAHDKIEIEFYPAFGTDGEYNYLFYLDGDSTPTIISLEALYESTGGKKRYLIEDLRPNTQYKLVLKAKHIKTGSMSKGHKEHFITTFDNYVADFQGVNSVTLVPGASDTSVEVEWVPAVMTGTIITTSYDPVYYLVTYISEDGGASNINNENYAGLDKQTERVPAAPNKAKPSNNPSSLVVTGLLPNTKYYFQVRAVHKLWDLIDSDENVTTNPLSLDSNSRFISVKTASSTSLFDFNAGGLTLQNPLGGDAYSKINAYWPAGEGTFTGYRVFWKETEEDDPETSDEIDSIEILNDIAAGTLLDDGGDPVTIEYGYKDLDSATNSYTIPNLEEYKYYHIKVVLCKTTECPLEEDDANAGIISDVKALRTEARLAPFSGITAIDHPTDASSSDRIKLYFDQAVLSQGYADTLRIFCLDPDDHSKFIELPANTGTLGNATVSNETSLFVINEDGDTEEVENNPAVADSGDALIGNCNGLSLKDPVNETSSFAHIDGVENIIAGYDDSRYCFAAAPSIASKDEKIDLAPELWSVRCINPEVKVPAADEFTGVKGSCVISENEATVNWDAPDTGIYNGYKVVWKEYESGENFDFNQALEDISDDDSDDDDDDFTTHGTENSFLADSDTSFTIDESYGLEPGKEYQVGILTVASVGGNSLYSEYNTGIVRCRVSLPSANFEEWSRVFAIGPKVDGRVPTTTPFGGVTETDTVQGHLFESINANGIPFETEINYGVGPDEFVDTNYQVPPGNYDTPPDDYADLIDGKRSEDLQIAASRYGIISLAWKDVELSFLNQEFIDGIAAEVATPRDERKFGYRVYRSDNNRVSWINVSDESGLIHSADYSYRWRNNADEVTEKMAFFTDYSVKYSATLTDIDKARIYWYKIVPVYDDNELDYDDSQFNPHNIVKVTLPPPNMALVHRKMANRTACLEASTETNKKEILKGMNDHYACEFNGVGAVAKTGSPWKLGTTVLDLGGDLLIDRYELGCNYTRGQVLADYANSNSFHDPDTLLSAFDGKTDAGNKFMGCASTHSASLQTIDGADGDDYNPNYRSVVHGDCISSGSYSRGALEVCVGAWDDKVTGTGSYNFPGARSYDSDLPYQEDCTNFVDKMMTQSEFAAVLYSKSNGSNSSIRIRGVGFENSGSIVTSAQGDGGNNSCQINLAAIGSDGVWEARWLGLNKLLSTNIDGSAEDITNKTLQDVLDGSVAYSGTETNEDFHSPDKDTEWNTSRIQADMKISRIMTSNSSKLPPIIGLSKTHASKICSAYKVQVGVGDDDGSFAATAAPAEKRIMRRQEFVMAAAWPEKYDDTQVNLLELGTTAEEKGCVGVTHPGTAAGQSDRGDNLGPSMSTIGLSHLYGGSSSNDTVNNEISENCVSKYGVQDLIGNLYEASVEELYCDYSSDVMQIYYGEENIVQCSVPINSGEEVMTGDTIDSAIIYMLDDDNNLTGTIKDLGCTLDPKDYKVWVKKKPEAGYCSFVDADALKPDVGIPYFRNQVSAIFYNIFNPDGNINDDIILPQHEFEIDQESVNTLRNGDGLFMHFGPTHLGPTFGTANSLAISSMGHDSIDDGMAEGSYFNHILGLPIQCSNNMGDGFNTCSLNSADNLLLTTSLLDPTPGDDTDQIVIPTNRSQVYNEGIKDSTFDSYQVSTIGPFDGYQEPYITEFYVKGIDGALPAVEDSLTRVSAISETRGPWGIATGLNAFTASEAAWLVSRNSSMKMRSGGKVGGVTNGRYTLEFADSALGTSSTDGSDGIRCVVKINEN